MKITVQVLSILLLTSILACPVGAVAEDSTNRVLGASFPALSPDGATLVFSYQADLWTVPADGGIARRLTVHEADDSHPVFSPDGKWIAFSSDRFGNGDVFLMSALGGEPRRLTFHSSDDSVTGFTPDGKSVVFHSRRDWLRHRIWTVPIDGGDPVVINRESGGSGIISPDGKFLAFTYGYVDLYRKGYHGNGDNDIWIRDLEKNTILQVTEYDGVDRNPVWAPDSHSLYFISDRETGIFNIWNLNLTSGEKTQVTRFEDGHLYWPTLSRDGSTLVFLHDFTLMKSDLQGSTAEIPIETASDFRSSLIKPLTFSSESDQVAFATDDKQIAISTHGEIFAFDKEGKEAVRLTENAARDGNPVWSPESDALFFISDRSGTRSIYRIDSTEKDQKNLTKARFRKVSPVLEETYPIDSFIVSPDGKTLVYNTYKGELYAAGIDGKNARLLHTGYMIEHLLFSPDSRWIAFTEEVFDWNREVFILALETGETHRISYMAGDEFLPFFTQDGKRLIFSAAQYHRDDDIYGVWLTYEEDEKYRDDDEKDEKNGEDKPGDKPSKKGNKEKDKKEEESKKVVPVKIDFDEIHKRVKKIAATEGDDIALTVSPDGKTILFKSNCVDDWKLYGLTDADKKGKIGELAGINVWNLRYTGDGSSVFYRTEKGQIGTLNPESGKTEPISFSGKMDVDVRAEFHQMYTETWNVMKYMFYDADLHGADWDAVYARYLPLVDHARSTREFHHAVRMMLGELNASHLGIWKNGGHGGGDKTGYLGVRVGSFIPGKGFPVTDVIKNSPADRMESRINTGDIITAINREAVGEEKTLAELLNETVGKKTDVSLMTAGKTPARRTVTLKPVGSWANETLAYEDWVDDNRKKVDELSNGRIGYAHILGMTGRYLRQFERELFGLNIDKEALVIDVRYNHGGNIHNELLTLLTGDPFGYSIPRDGGKQFHPPYKWLKPSTLLINEWSFSDAEVFPNGYQILGIGKVIGTQTWGGVIGTGGMKLLDGSWFRIPFVGWYNLDGTNMENRGALPDIEIDNFPTELEDGKDTQLDKAVEVLLEELK